LVAIRIYSCTSITLYVVTYIVAHMLQRALLKTTANFIAGLFVHNFAITGDYGVYPSAVYLT